MWRIYYQSLGECDPTSLIFNKKAQAVKTCKEFNHNLCGLGKYICKYEEEKHDK